MNKVYTNEEVIQIFANEVGTDLVESQQYLERCQYCLSAAVALYVYGVVPEYKVRSI